MKKLFSWHRNFYKYRFYKFNKPVHSLFGGGVGGAAALISCLLTIELRRATASSDRLLFVFLESLQDLSQPHVDVLYYDRQGFNNKSGEYECTSEVFCAISDTVHISDQEFFIFCRKWQSRVTFTDKW